METLEYNAKKVKIMKGIKPNDKFRTFTGLYMDSQNLSVFHERQKFGNRAFDGDDESGQGNTVNKATFNNQ